MKWDYNFVKHRKYYFMFAIAVVIIGISSLMVQGLNLGVDFVSGTRISAHLNQEFDTDKLVNIYKGLGMEPSIIRAAGENSDIAIARFDTTVDATMLPAIREALIREFPNLTDIEESSVSPQVGEELAKKAIYSVLLASALIVIYIAFRFEYRFAVSGIIALLFASFFVITMFSILQLEVNIPFIAAILTIIGYSINDTIVVFDRIRENLKFAKIRQAEDLEILTNNSIRQTLTRSINTVLTVMFGSIALVIFGGESIRDFALAITFGLAAGASSSIFIAAQIWLNWRIFDLSRIKQQQ